MSEITLGRPKDLEKREAILVAAQRLFWEEGWDHVPTAAIAKAAGVSKVTVFNAFGSKIGLVEALILRAASRFEDVLGSDMSEGSLEDQLNELGKAVLPILLSEEIVALEAILTPLARRHPSLIEKFDADGPGKTLALLQRRLEQIFDRCGASLRADPETVETLVSLWQGALPDAVRMGLRQPPDATELSRRVCRGTCIFLRGIGCA